MIGTYPDKGTSLDDFKFREEDLLILGNEKVGLDGTVLSSVKERIYIPMEGKTSCINVSNAAAIIMAEYNRQKRKGELE